MHILTMNSVVPVLLFNNNHIGVELHSGASSFCVPKTIGAFPVPWTKHPCKSLVCVTSEPLVLNFKQGLVRHTKPVIVSLVPWAIIAVCHFLMNFFLFVSLCFLHLHQVKPLFPGLNSSLRLTFRFLPCPFLTLGFSDSSWLGVWAERYCSVYSEL